MKISATQFIEYMQQVRDSLHIRFLNFNANQSWPLIGNVASKCAQASD